MKFETYLILLRLLLPLTILLAPASVYAESLAAPKGKVILTVTGNIGNTNAGDKAEFDREMLEALGITDFNLKGTKWTKGPQMFQGVLGSKILDAVAAHGKTLVARAYNDYQSEIPVSDLRRYPVLFALKRNGRYMTIRDKGPIWVIYPIHMYPELDNEKSTDKWIWQLASINIQ